MAQAKEREREIACHERKTAVRENGWRRALWSGAYARKVKDRAKGG